MYGASLSSTLGVYTKMSVVVSDASFISPISTVLWIHWYHSWSWHLGILSGVWCIFVILSCSRLHGVLVDRDSSVPAPVVPAAAARTLAHVPHWPPDRELGRPGRVPADGGGAAVKGRPWRSQLSARPSLVATALSSVTTLLLSYL